MKRALIVGGANGIGLAIATELAINHPTDCIYIVDKAPIPTEYTNPKFCYHQFDLTSSDYSLFNRFSDIDTLMITAGFGHLALFRDIPEEMIKSYFDVNTLPVMRLIKHFYPRLEAKAEFRCGVMVSIAGYLSSPFFSVYAATKAALRVFIESVNVELHQSGTTNKILNVSPGSIHGTSFNQGKTDLSETTELARQIVCHLARRDDLFIPQYEETYQAVLERYHRDFRAEGLHSYEYKKQRIAETLNLWKHTTD